MFKKMLAAFGSVKSCNFHFKKVISKKLPRDLDHATICAVYFINENCAIAQLVRIESNEGKTESHERRGEMFEMRKF